MGNKAVKPYHLFRHAGGWHVIDIEGMRAAAVDEATADFLANPDGGSPLVSLAAERLAELGLLPVDEEQAATAAKEIKPDPMPVVNIALFLTQSCNLRCVYCYGGGGGYGSGGDMAEKTAFQAVDWLLDQAGKIKKLHIGFFGGEPFLNFPLMKAVAEYAKQKAREMGKEVAFHTTTNATLLDDEKIDFIKKYRLEVLVSFDGTKELQDAQRPYADGQGSYDAALPGIKKLLAALPETPGHAVITGDTDPEAVKDALREIGFAQFSVMPASRSLFAGPDGVRGERNFQKLLLALEEEVEVWLRLTASRYGGALQGLKDKSGLYPSLTALLHNSKRRHGCGAGRGLVGVSVSGDIYLCHRFVGREEYKLGSVFVPGLAREEYLASQLERTGECSACFARYYCGGGCKHDNAGACGSAFVPSRDMCRLRRRELELAAAVVCQLSSGDRAFLTEQGIFPPKPCPLDF